MSESDNRLLDCTVDGPVCSRCRVRPKDDAPCPYQTEINDATDEEAMCDCCDECRYQCAMDI